MATTTIPSPAPATAPGPAPAPSRPPPKRFILSFRGQDIPVVLPSSRDLRLKLSAVLITLQVLGQTVLRFKVSIAQILVTIGVCALIEGVLTFRRERVLAWPASAIQTGSSVGFILRASGTRHGDLWSFHGIQYFVAAAVISMMGKHLIRSNGRHVFNPSNLGIVAVLLVVGPSYVFSEHLWWGPAGWRVGLAFAVILMGGVWVVRPAKMIAMSVSFLTTFAVIVAAFAASGRSFYATWRVDPITGTSYWLNIALSPEVIALVFFMYSDPQTSPKSRRGRIIYGALGAVGTSALLFFQHTEFGIKVALLSSLTLVCSVVPMIEALNRRALRRRVAAVEAVPVEAVPVAAPLSRRLVRWARTPVIVATSLIAVGATVDTAGLVANKEIVLIERDLPSPDSAPGTISASSSPHNRHRQ